ncbi:hypothetical protein [Mycetohabitans sp. B46]|uniref:hypothetical protein n=1 Tax=Mycetohabitans sp. B46 TaxID=2772536 RepID=UPI00307D97C8
MYIAFTQCFERWRYVETRARAAIGHVDIRDQAEPLGYALVAEANANVGVTVEYLTGAFA